MTSRRFRRWELPHGVATSAVLPIGGPMRGIYILEFADGQEYVGQTVNLASRLGEHRRLWGDVVAVRFLTEPTEPLRDLEYALIAERRVSNELRNIAGMALPLPTQVLDEVVDQQVQEEWLQGRTIHPELGDRGRIALQRKRTRKKYDVLSARADFPDLLAALASYVAECIPWPHQTEHRFWSVTSLPSTGRRADWRRLTALSINSLEVLVLGELRNTGGAWRPGGFVNIAALDVIPQAFTEWVRPADYSSLAPGSVTSMEVESFEEVAALLADPAIAGAARSLAMGQLRKGRGLFAQFHDFNLADDIFAALESD